MSRFFILIFCLHTLSMVKLEEVVLTLILESFKISFSDEEIIWVTPGIAAPSTKKEPARLQLPLIVEHVP